jgi:hypothetical protein
VNCDSRGIDMLKLTGAHSQRNGLQCWFTKVNPLKARDREVVQTRESQHMITVTRDKRQFEIMPTARLTPQSPLLK